MNHHDAFHAHEALRTCHVLTDTFFLHVAESPFVQAHFDLAKQANEVTQAMAALYQAIGRKVDA